MSKYAKGANFERQVIKECLKNHADLVMRGAGSKSYGKIKVDIIALYGSRLELYQCKKGKGSYKKEETKFYSVPLADKVYVVRKFVQVK